MLLYISNIFNGDFINIFLFIFNVVLSLMLLFSLLYIRHSKRRWDKITDYLGDVTKTVDSVRYGNLTKKINKLDIIDSKNLTESLNRMIETLKDREIMVEEFQKDLMKQNKILEKTVNSLSDGLIIIDNKGKIYRANSLIADWFEQDGKDLLGKSIQDYIEFPENKSVYKLNNDEINIPTKLSANFLANSVMLNIADKKEHYIIIIKNITDQKELETLKEDFVATLTHDLKVPIIAETNMIELFLNENFGKINEKQKLALKNMQVSNKELLDLVQIVLDTYKIGKLALYKESVMLKSFINEIIEEMTPIAQKNKNNFIFHVNRDIRVSADKIQLKRVIKNLIQNAISYGKAKTPIEIKIGEIPNYVIIKVKDFGEGISKENIEKIFNKYYSASKRFRKIGTGLGLYLGLQIAKAHGGDLTVESKEGEYTEFCIKLPVDYERHTIPY